MELKNQGMRSEPHTLKNHILKKQEMRTEPQRHGHPILC